MDRPPRRRTLRRHETPGHRGRTLSLIGATGIALGAVIVARTVLGPTPAEAVAVAPGGVVTFVARAVGVTDGGVTLVAEPRGGARLADVAAGARLEVAGVVRSRAGLWWRDSYWVRTATPDGVRQGFVASDAVELAAGTPPRLLVGNDDIPGMLTTDNGLVLEARAPATVTDPVETQGVAGQDSTDASTASRPMGSAASAGAVAIPWLPDTVTRWASGIADAASRHGLDPNLLAIITLVESGGDPGAGSYAGARGLTQVMPTTGTGIAAELGVVGFTADALWQPETALNFGAYYLAKQLRAFGLADDTDWQRSVERAAAAYNGGPGTVMSGRLPAETQRYQRWVGGMWRERREASSPTYDAWLAAGGRVLVDAARQGMRVAGG